MKNLYILTGSCGLVGTDFHDEQIFESQEEANAYVFDWACQEAESYGEVVFDDYENFSDDDFGDSGRIILESDIESIAELYDKEKHGEENPWGIPYADIYLRLSDPEAYKQMLIDREASEFDWFKVAGERFFNEIGKLDRHDAVAFLLNKIDYDVFKEILYTDYLTDEEREKA